MDESSYLCRAADTLEFPSVDMQRNTPNRERTPIEKEHQEQEEQQISPCQPKELASSEEKIKSLWPCPSCKVPFKKASELQSHLSEHIEESEQDPNITEREKEPACVIETSSTESVLSLFASGILEPELSVNNPGSLQADDDFQREQRDSGENTPNHCEPEFEKSIEGNVNENSCDSLESGEIQNNSSPTKVLTYLAKLSEVEKLRTWQEEFQEISRAFNPEFKEMGKNYSKNTSSKESDEQECLKDKRFDHVSRRERRCRKHKCERSSSSSDENKEKRLGQQRSRDKKRSTFHRNEMRRRSSTHRNERRRRSSSRRNKRRRRSSHRNERGRRSSSHRNSHSVNRHVKRHRKKRERPTSGSKKYRRYRK